MPSSVEHVEQARSNAKFLAAIQIDPAAQHPDWIITVAFYTALHLVDAELAQRRIYCKTHWERAPKVAQQLAAVSPKYLRLYTESRAARYDCRPIRPERADSVLKTLYEPVRAHLCGLLGISL